MKPKQYKFGFYVSEKTRTKEFGALLAHGAAVHGDEVVIIRQEDYEKPLPELDGAANLGLARACARLMKAYLGAGKHFLFFDKGYSKPKGYWRVSVDAWQPLAYFQRFKRPQDRRLVAGPRKLISRPKQEADTAILFAAACQNYTNFCELGNVNDYNRLVIRTIREHTDRPILYRPNPSWFTKHNDEFQPIHEEFDDVELSVPEIPFDKELARTHLLVTHGSSASVGALQNGVPIMVLGGGVAKAQALNEHQWDQIEEPYWPKEGLREQFFNDLNYCQWTVEEYKNGKAWEEIRLVLSSLEPAAQVETPLSEVVRQYKLMHEHPGYFRGLTTLKYVEQIRKLILDTYSPIILDYGSGKGEQYQAPHLLQNEWGVQVACYDPGVEQFKILPAGRFDGVICCDVMEHVPEFAVQTTLQEILSKATRFVFFAIATNPATKTLPDGRNCHLTVRPRKWWVEQIELAKKSVSISTGIQGLQVVLTIPGANDAES